MTEAAATDRLRVTSLGAVATVAAYGALGAILLVTRFAGLDRGMWLDEIWTVEDFVRQGPGEILAGPYQPNNHELFSILGWITTSAVGESEVALRLWSAVPFVAGVALVTAWLHARVGALSGILFLFLATGAPLLLDITWQARGYGLAFFAMSALVVAALESDRSGSTWWLAAFFAAGLVGTLTLPNFGVAFVGTAAVLLASRELRTRALAGLALTVVVSAAWYAPHIDDLRESSRQDYGVEIGLFGILTAPFDQILVPGLLWIDGVVVLAGVEWLPLVALALLFVVSSPLVRWERRTASLVSGVVATVLVLWITHVQVVPRFLSFLLVPLFMLCASGAAAILARSPRPPLVRGLLTLAALGALAITFASPALEVATLPREANADAATIVEQRASPAAEVYPRIVHPRTLAFYLDRSLQERPTQRDVPRLCSRPREIVLVVQPWVLPPLDVPCLSRPGVERYRFEQYARGEEISVWIVPPRGT